MTDAFRTFIGFTIILITSELINAAPTRPYSTVLATQPEWGHYNYIEPNGRGTYAFGYDVEDPETSNVQFRNEEKHPNGTVIGSFGYLEPDGNVHLTHYIADEQGFRATVEDSARGGMLKPIPVMQNTNYLSHGYSQQMLAAIESLQFYKKQKVQEQRLRPFDQLTEKQKLEYRQRHEKISEKRNGELGYLSSNLPINTSPYLKYDNQQLKDEKGYHDLEVFKFV